MYLLFPKHLVHLYSLGCTMPICHITIVALHLEQAKKGRKEHSAGSKLLTGKLNMGCCHEADLCAALTMTMTN